MNVDRFSGISLELALNSRVSTGGWQGIERGGTIGSTPLTPDQVEFVFWCLSHTPTLSEKASTIECNGKTFDPETLTLDGERITVEPVSYPRIKCPSIRLHWVSEKKEKSLRNVAFATTGENASLMEWGLGQEMVHVAGAIAQVGVNMIGGTNVDLVPMTPYLSAHPPQNYRTGNLPEPVRDGAVSAVACIKAWTPADTFTREPVARSQLGQLLWAGLGCTPHKTFRYHRYAALTSEGQGKTIPSASAFYTTALYVLAEEGIFKYVNWDDENGVATHSLGLIKNGTVLNVGEFTKKGIWVYTRTGDLVSELQHLVPSLPRASTYIVVASNRKLRPYFSLMEASYSVLHILLQAHALELASTIVVLSQKQMRTIQLTLGLIDQPIALIPISY